MANNISERFCLIHIKAWMTGIIIVQFLYILYDITGRVFILVRKGYDVALIDAIER